MFLYRLVSGPLHLGPFWLEDANQSCPKKKQRNSHPYFSELWHGCTKNIKPGIVIIVQR